MIRAPKVETYAAILTIVAGLVGFYFVFQVEWLLMVALGLAVFSLAIPKAAKWIAWAWIKLGELLGLVNGYIIMALLYFVVLTPLAVLRRTFTNPKFKRKMPKSGSLFVWTNTEVTPKDFENPW